MSMEKIRKIVREEIISVLSEGYHNVEEILDDLMSGNITKEEAKKYISDIKDSDTSMPAGRQTSGGGSSGPSQSVSC